MCQIKQLNSIKTFNFLRISHIFVAFHSSSPPSFSSVFSPTHLKFITSHCKIIVVYTIYRYTSCSECMSFIDHPMSSFSAADLLMCLGRLLRIGKPVWELVCKKMILPPSVTIRCLSFLIWGGD